MALVTLLIALTSDYRVWNAFPVMQIVPCMCDFACFWLWTVASTIRRGTGAAPLSRRKAITIVVLCGTHHCLMLIMAALTASCCPQATSAVLIINTVFALCVSINALRIYCSMAHQVHALLLTSHYTSSSGVDPSTLKSSLRRILAFALVLLVGAALDCALIVALSASVVASQRDLFNITLFTFVIFFLAATQILGWMPLWSRSVAPSVAPAPPALRPAVATSGTKIEPQVER